MATLSRAAELKQQGALEAARDPDSSVTAEQAEDKVLHEARNAGSAAYKFDPDATPEEKAAQAKAVCRHTFNPLLEPCANPCLNSTFPPISTTTGNLTPLPWLRMP